MRVVVALGGNALLRRGEAFDLATQRGHVAAAAAALAPLAAEHRLVVTHGNGPQVGMLALAAEAEGGFVQPLDLLGAESEGMIGYLISQELGSRLPGTSVAALLTQTVVDGDDPAFASPTKPIGPVYDEAAARELAASRGWTIAADGAGYRRVVASPEPVAIVELAAIGALLDAGTLVCCCGGGGVPVSLDDDGALGGVEAVIDKDLAAALLARELGADLLLIGTDVEGVVREFGTPAAAAIDQATPAELRALDLPAGSMGPKAEACARFVEATGGRAAIVDIARLAEAARGEAGTQVVAATGAGRDG